jgi:hypothetical protein
MELLLLTETTSNKSVGNVMVASASFTATPPESTATVSVTESPTEMVVALVLSCTAAAFAHPNQKKNDAAAVIAAQYNLLFFKDLMFAMLKSDEGRGGAQAQHDGYKNDYSTSRRTGSAVPRLIFRAAGRGRDAYGRERLPAKVDGK